MKNLVRRTFWSLLALGSVALVAFAPDESGVDPVRPAQAESRRPSRGPVQEVPAHIGLHPRVAGYEEAAPLFASANAPLAPVAATPVAAPPPEPFVLVGPPAPQPVVAPRLSVTVAGRFRDERGELFLLRGEGRDWIVRVGDSVATDWRLERSSGNQLQFTHRPTGASQSLDLGGMP